MLNETKKFIPQILSNNRVVIKPVWKWGPRFDERSKQTQLQNKALPKS